MEQIAFTHCISSAYFNSNFMASNEHCCIAIVIASALPVSIPLITFANSSTFPITSTHAVPILTQIPTIQ